MGERQPRGWILTVQPEPGWTTGPMPASWPPPFPPEHLRPPSNEGRSGGNDALGGPHLMATACTLGLLSHFSHQMRAAAEATVRAAAPI